VWEKKTFLVGKLALHDKIEKKKTMFLSPNETATKFEKELLPFQKVFHQRR
jgi:hypothetical protein